MTAILVLLSLALASPGPMKKREGCIDFVGTASGNDPSVRVRLQICGQGEKVTGRFQWSSDNSGWNERVLAGTASSGGRLLLRDIRFDESHPAPGWVFCLIDRYDLQPAPGGRLKGTYDSKACHDHATVDLDRE